MGNNDNIKKLILDLEGLEYDDSEFRFLFSSIQTLDYLKHFELILDATEIEDEGIG